MAAFEDAITWTTDGADAGDVNYRLGEIPAPTCGVLLNSEGIANKCIAAPIGRVHESMFLTSEIPSS